MLMPFCPVMVFGYLLPKFMILCTFWPSVIQDTWFCELFVLPFFVVYMSDFVNFFVCVNDFFFTFHLPLLCTWFCELFGLPLLLCAWFCELFGLPLYCCFCIYVFFVFVFLELFLWSTLILLLCSWLFELFVLHFLLCTWFWELFVMHFLLCTWFFVLFVLHFFLCSWFFELFVLHFLLCTWFWELLVVPLFVVYMSEFVIFWVCFLFCELKKSVCIMAVTTITTNSWFKISFPVVVGDWKIYKKLALWCVLGRDVSNEGFIWLNVL